MLTLDITATLGQTITPSRGIPDQEFAALRTSVRRYVEDWLQERERGEHAWSMDPYDKQVIQQVKNATSWVKAEKIRTVVWIGIGGSGLGPKVIQEVFEGPETLEFILMDSIDPAMIELQLSLIDWKEALIVVASKSGGTLEPMSLFFLCFEKMQEARKERAAEFVIAVTDPHGGTLRSFCKEWGIRMLPIPPGVGGRFSIFTPVGLFPLALLGGDIDRFVRGAKEIDTICQNPNLDENPAAQLAAVQFLLDTKRDYPVRVIMPYSTRLASIARWDQQLVAESLGKSEAKNPIPLAAVGTEDQHSLLQQWMEGPRLAWHLFIREEERPKIAVPLAVEKSFASIAGKTFAELIDACYEGTSRALTGAKRPHATLTITRLDEEHLGQLFYLLMIEVILLGKLYRIDPYDQPGVEAGKKITKQILE
jgi:glucose-6-phosphate isomerase